MPQLSRSRQSPVFFRATDAVTKIAQKFAQAQRACASVQHCEQDKELGEEPLLARRDAHMAGSRA